MNCPHPEKQAHRSFNAALKARDSLEAGDGVDLALRPYRCACGAWHLGHKGKGAPPRERIKAALKAGNRNSAASRRRRKR